MTIQIDKTTVKHKTKDKQSKIKTKSPDKQTICLNNVGSNNLFFNHGRPIHDDNNNIFWGMTLV